MAVGQEIFDGAGNVTGIEDQDSSGLVIPAQAFNGTYAVDADGLGRGAIALGGIQQSFYLASPGRGFVIDTGSYDDGMFEPQTGTPFGDSSMSGNFVLGALPWPFNWTFSPVSGVLSATGSGSIVGTSDGFSGTNLNFSGSYSVAGNGRAAMTITPVSGSPSNWGFYVVSPTKAVGIDIDPGTTNSAVRIIEK